MSDAEAAGPGRPGTPGWAEVEAVLGPLAGLDLLDLACGSGSWARLAVARGASSVLALGLDLELLDEARRRQGADGGPQRRIHYEQADLAQATLPFESYDLAYGALALAGVDDPVRLARMVRSGLRQRARLVLALATQDTVPVEALRTGGLDPVVATPWRHGPGEPGLLVVATKPPRGR